MFNQKNRSKIKFLSILMGVFLVSVYHNVSAEIRRTSPKTYYYELVKVVNEQGNEEDRSEDGQFYTITHNTCYESNREGMDEGLGHLSYHAYNDEKKLHIYCGPSYYGAETTFYFNSDYSRVNIRTSVGMTYVLSKKNAPEKFIASDHKVNRKRMEDILKGTYVPPVQPVPPITSTIDNTQSQQHRRCAGCGGSGNCTMCRGKGWYKNGNKIYNCTSCGGSGSCRVCHGKGHCF